MTTYNEKLLRRAYAQSVANLVGLSDEETGSRWYSALQKGVGELETNKTIRFDRVNKVLRFVSRFSGKRRIVTKNGCSDLCDCKGLPSYHFGLWQILSRYHDLLADEPAGQPEYHQRQINSNGLRDASLPKTTVRI